VASVIACPVCRTDNAEGARFCTNCGSRLATSAVVAEERKVVTALFCDLVGFTATSEGADPEDVDRMLTRYFAMARGQIEAHGGVVEKFIGDAVVGVFGVPATHEDDPERAVRAGLRIAQEGANLQGLGAVPLRLRVGINTGETLVRLDVSPGVGERFLAGDTINTASRIQSVAPEMGVAVGLATYEATRRKVEYRELPPATLKGKAEPVRVFEAVAPVARSGIDLAGHGSTPLLGREDDLAALERTFEESIAERSIRVATVVGEPGLGKSRLVAELLAYVEAQPVLVTWRQGRCLPYGAGISFWALGEIVKAHAGILESDPGSVVIEKLEGVLPEDADRAWLRQRLLPLLGIDSGAPTTREEQFAAWRRFLVLVAGERPTILVFEDLHWADEPMVAFLEELATSGERVPMLVIGTARPEFLERHPAFPGLSASAVRVALSALDAGSVAHLASHLLGASSVEPGLEGPIVERAAGNPLFVEEFVRLLVDGDLVVETGGVLRLRGGASLPVPDTIQSLLAARLDALPGEWKAVLADASVVGRVFWDGAVIAMGGRSPAEVAAALDGLGRRQLVRPIPTSSMAGEHEYDFWHVLARDVAYGALPRTARATRHAAAARWIEAKAGDRIDDVVEILAHHYSTALDLARAAGAEDLAPALEAPAFRFLTTAGERALGIDTGVAVSLLERALELAPVGHPERPAALSRLGQALADAGRLPEAIDRFEAAVDGFVAVGDGRSAGATMLAMSNPLRFLGRRQRGREAAALLEPLGPSLPLARVYLRRASGRAINGDYEESLEEVRRAAEILDAAPDGGSNEGVRLRASMLVTAGQARAGLGDVGGLQDMRQSIDLLIEAGDGGRAVLDYMNFAIMVAHTEGPRSALRLTEEGLAFAQSRGVRPEAIGMEINALHFRYDSGEHEMVLREATRLEAEMARLGADPMLREIRSTALRVATLRGVTSTAELLDRLVSTAPDPEEGADALIAAFGPAAAARHLLGDADGARADLASMAATSFANATLFGATLMPGVVRTALALGEVDVADTVVRDLTSAMPFGRHSLAASRAAIAEARGALDEAIVDYADVAERWEGFGVVPELAFALLGHGRSLVKAGRPDVAGPSLARARDIFTSLRAGPNLAEIESLVSR
jgi:class 3 adenylate cyclase/tetratricopeptide (TPR) repeat protein